MDQSMPPQNEAPMNSIPPTGEETPKKQYGPLIGIIIIVALLAVGGFYLWGMQLMKTDEDTGAEQADMMTEDLRTYSNSDEIDAIEADLNATSIDNIDSGANEVEGELQVQ